MLYNAFIKPIFCYCPLMWMYCQKNIYQKIKRIHKRSLKVIYQNYNLNYKQLLQIDGEESFHQMHLKLIITEIFETINSLNPSFMKRIFVRKDSTYNLRVSNLLSLPHTNTTKYGVNSVFFRGSITWNTLPDKIKSVESLNIFKAKLSALGGLYCNCTICK